MTGKPVGWNPRYVLFAASNGRSPEGQKEHDIKENTRCEFSLWIQARWREYRGLCESGSKEYANDMRAKHDLPRVDSRYSCICLNHEIFDQWLRENVEGVASNEKP